MTQEEIAIRGETKVTELFDKCWTAYEDVCKQLVTCWHAKHPDMKEMSGWLSRLSEQCWMYCDLITGEYDSFVIKFDSLDELDLKLAIRGY